MAIYRVTRTSQPGLAPAPGSLVPGQLAVEMATQPWPRLWVGVTTDIDSTGRRLLISSSGGGSGGVTIPDAPTDGQIYGRNGETETWQPVLPIAGGTLTGNLVLNNDANLALEAVPLEQVGGFLGFPVQSLAPTNPNNGDHWFNTNTGQLLMWNGSAWVVPPTAGYLSLSGGTMVGNLILNGAPSNASDPNQAATRGYVDEFLTGAMQFLGTMDANTGIVTYTESSGLTGTQLVSPGTVKDSYVIVSVSGTIPSGSPYLSGTAVQVGDWLISDGTEWFVILVSGQQVLAQNVAVTPPVLGMTNVQTALSALASNFQNYAPLFSANLQGTPTTPTPPQNDFSQKIANTAWVEVQIQLALQGAAGDIDNILFIGDLLGAQSIAGSGEFFDQVTLGGDSTGDSGSLSPNFVTSIELTGDASSVG